MAQILSGNDVTRLLEDSSVDSRAETAGKVAQEFASSGLSDSERAIAEEIFRLLMRDAEVQVREALAVHVKESQALPHDIALSLASDVDEVALPILEFSQVLTDGDLIEIVRSHGASKQKAIAGRKDVSSEVSEALVETKNEDVVATLVKNQGAEISEKTLQTVLDDWGDNEHMHAPLVRRRELPISIAERMVHLVSQSLQEHLVTHHDLPADLANDVVLQSREKATIGLLSDDAAPMDVEELVEHLRAHDRLTPTILLRSLCMGDMAFFETALAKLARVPVINARTLIHDSGRLGLKALYEKASLPPVLYDALRVAVDVAEETEYDGDPNDRERYARRMIERILTQYEDIGAENIEYLLSKLSQLGTAGSPAAALRVS